MWIESKNGSLNSCQGKSKSGKLLPGQSTNMSEKLMNQEEWRGKKWGWAKLEDCREKSPTSSLHCAWPSSCCTFPHPGKRKNILLLKKLNQRGSSLWDSSNSACGSSLLNWTLEREAKASSPLWESCSLPPSLSAPASAGLSGSGQLRMLCCSVL